MRGKKAKKTLEKVVSTYNEIGEEFDRTRQSPVKEFNLFRPYLKAAARILDLGCGNGRLLKSLETGFKTPGHAPAFHYMGLDNSDKMLETARKNFPHGNFSKGDQLQIPVAEEAMDVIFDLRAFHHLPSRLMRRQALLEMNRVLKPGGVLVVTVWNLWQSRFSLIAFKSFLRFLFTFGTYGWNDFFVPWGKKAKRYYHAFSPMELNNLVTNAGFEVEELFSVRDGQKAPLTQSHDIVIIARKNADN